MTIDHLLEPVSAESPCGDDLSFSSEFDAVQEMRREDDATLDQGGWVTALKTADWPGVAASCEQLLRTRSKDLRLAAWLTEAWTHTRRFAGLADGLLLSAQLCERHWAQLHPLPEDEDHEQRIGNLAWLLARVEGLARGVPLLQAGAQAMAWHDMEAARLRPAPEDGETPTAADELARLQRDTPRSLLAENVAGARDALAALATLEATVDARLGAQGPGFAAARRALEDVLHQAQRLSPEPASAGVADADTAPRVSAAPTAAPASARSALPLQSRSEALRQLREVAAFFRETEPHSPVAYLADKAARWGEMPLHTWLRAVVKDEAALAQLEDMLGVALPGDAALAAGE